MESSLRDESRLFSLRHSVSGWRVAQRISQPSRLRARGVLALTNPTNRAQSCRFSMAECVRAGFDHQRLDYLRHAITSFKKGGESQKLP